MSEMPWQLFYPEMVEITSGLDGTTVIPMLCDAWMLLDLVKMSVPTRIIENRPFVGGTGSTPLDAATDELRTGMRFQLTGTYEQDGTPVAAANVRAQFRRHWVFLNQHLFLPVEPLDATYTPPDPDEDPIDFQIQFGTPDLNPENGMWPTDWSTVLQVVLPGGPLIPAGGS